MNKRLTYDERKSELIFRGRAESYLVEIAAAR